MMVTMMRIEGLNTENQIDQVDDAHHVVVITGDLFPHIPGNPQFDTVLTIIR